MGKGETVRFGAAKKVLFLWLVNYNPYHFGGLLVSIAA